MDAKQIKPYTFWIICGVIVVTELTLIAFWPITDEEGREPADVKIQLDEDFKKLKDLHDRAERTPTGVMDAERPDHIKALTDNFLITPKWQSVLQPHVDKYNQQLAAIKKDLAARSAILHEPIASSTDLYAWHTSYVSKTKEVLLSLRKAKALIVEEGNPLDDLETGSRIRAQVGFYTRADKTPEATEHRDLTIRLRIMEKLSEALIASGSNALPSPAVKTGRESDLETKLPARIIGAEWKRSDASKSLSGSIAEFADAHELSLTLEGSTSSLISSEAAIEGISAPIMLVAGGTLSARAPMGPGARKNTPDEPMNLKLSIVTIDFSRVLTPSPTEAIAGGTVK